MMIEELLKNTSVKPKEKTEILSNWLLDVLLPIDELISFANHQKDSLKATCIEAIEYATSKNPNIATEAVLVFVTNALSEKAPRIKWESAKVIKNIAHLFPSILDKSVVKLMNNAKDNGTVVRWSSAYALSEILHLTQNSNLLSEIEYLCEKEEKNSIKKIYLDALKKN